MTTRAALLALVDGRLPAGGHAHSATVEAFVRRGEVHDVTSLASLLAARLATVGYVDATVAAAVVLGADDVATIDAEANARIASPAARAVSRALGRQLTRVAARIWPAPVLDECVAAHGEGPHHAVALGAAARAAGLDALDAAVAAAYGAITTPATAAVRLLGLDPVAVHATVARLAPRVDDVARAARDDVMTNGLARAAAPSALRSEMAAEEHSHLEVRLFAS